MIVARAQNQAHPTANHPDQDANPPRHTTRPRRHGGSRQPGAPVPGGTLDPLTIPKFTTPLVIPPAMPRTSEVTGKKGEKIDYYEIAVRQFTQKILPNSMNLDTPVWGFGSATTPGTFNYPAFTINATVNKPVRVKWINDLTDPVSGNYRPQLVPVDQTVHWANPPGGEMGRDMHGHSGNPYVGPAPIVVHLHGGQSSEESDGYAEAWYLPAASNIPAGYATVGSRYDEFKRKAEEKYGVTWEPGSAVFQYANKQRAATAWFHDHTLGMTRCNVYAGPAGFYLIHGGAEDLPAGALPGPLPQAGDAPGTRYYEIPLAIQDRSFNSDGTLFYPDSRTFFDGFTGPFLPDPNSDISPIWNPEFFGNCMVVNGKTWPYLDVEPRRYRFRILNGCNARTLILRMTATASGGGSKTPPAFWQIGTEGGFLAAPVELADELLMPAERADVIIDFTGFQAGDKVRLINAGPDSPYGGGVAGADFPIADANTTGQVMEFRVVALNGTDTSTPPNQLQLPAIKTLGPAAKTRQVSLNELDSAVMSDVGPRMAMLGTLVGATGVPKTWNDPITEEPLVGDTEVWEIYNFTADAHPIHVHEVLFQVVNREISNPAFGTPGTIKPRPAWENGWKETVIAFPGEITRIKMRFGQAGLYAWHCHIVEHEDHEMMRPYRIRERSFFPLIHR